MVYDIFIARPRLAIVISLLITIAGLIAMRVIPVAQYPDIAPPTVQVSAFYPGADSEVIESAVAQPIESAINGVEGMRYMSSSSSADGTYSLTVSFEVGVDPDIAAINIQNRIAAVESTLPAEVRDDGVSVTKSAGDLLQAFLFFSTDGSRDGLFINNYLAIAVLDEIKRVPGVGSAQQFGGGDYAMRVWLDADALDSYRLTASDVSAALQTQNIQAPIGRIGSAPIFGDQQLQLNLTTTGRLVTPEEFENVILLAEPGGATVRVADVGRVELSAENFDQAAFYEGRRASVLGISLLPGANAVSVAEAVNLRLSALSERFPDGLAYRSVLDNSKFVGAMIDKVVVTLAEAFGLVALVILLFLGRVRSTVIPLIAVPVAVIGTFAVLLIAGMSANTISLLAMILVIGIVVDDAIIVVENVERVMEENPEMPVNEAVSKAMREIAGSIIAITLVLLSVFVPVAFLGGSSGTLLREFAVTVSAAMVISAINALTLAPALAALFLRPGPVAFAPLRWVSRRIDGLTKGYTWTIARLLRVAPLAFVLSVGAGYIAFQSTQMLPSGFVPEEDKGFAFVVVTLPEGTSLNRTQDLLLDLTESVVEDPAIDIAVPVAGIDFLGGGAAPNTGVIFVTLLPYELREDPELSSFAVVRRLGALLASIPDGTFFPVNPPAIDGIGQVGGLEYNLEAVTGQNAPQLAAAARGMIVAASAAPEIAAVFTTFSAETPRLRLDVNRERAQVLGVEVADVFRALQINLGGAYVNDFNLFGRTWSVRLQSDAADRNEISDVLSLRVRNTDGDMISLSSFATVSLEAGPRLISRHNNYRSAALTVAPMPGVGDGVALAAMEELSRTTLPDGYAYEWSGQALEQVETSDQTLIVLALALLFAYLFLVALYESWAIPIAVLTSVSVAGMGAVLALLFFQMSFDLYAQIGLIILIALSAKNAILVASFVLERRTQGDSPQQAALDGARLRFRPIMMTALSFILGLIPLATATGAGAGAMVAVGIPVLFGMLASAVFGILLTPMLLLTIESFRARFGSHHPL
ncbi:efflux RND transporter permease subunit [Litoreibacter roseus]|uniref:Efflux pump membrane transporter n=1 Tax=Litoreibacter roseus TaxID=2601869 RepID=A0A6N6JL98_9RHOB|nr:efflux RND transporter permease subunit [Litoreibacter roseus]GFE67083.1 multidrug efflux RND transporter permease subunit [Litoreibacter roseus]